MINVKKKKVTDKNNKKLLLLSPFVERRKVEK